MTFKGLTRAMKTIPKNKLVEEDYQKLLGDIKLICELDHPNIVKTYECY